MNKKAVKICHVMNQLAKTCTTYLMHQIIIEALILYMNMRAHDFGLADVVCGPSK